MKKCGVLFVLAVFVSFDSGANWTSFRSNMAPATVTDLPVHPREGDPVARIDGRGVWLTNIVPLRGVNRARLISRAVVDSSVGREAGENE